MRDGQGTMVFVYVWLLLLFLLLVLYGNYSYSRNYQGNSHKFLTFALVAFANFTLLICVLVAGLGGIQADGEEERRDDEDGGVGNVGFFGQPGVLLLTTSLYGLIYSVVFAVWTKIRTFQYERSSWSTNTTTSGGYYPRKSPPKQLNEEERLSETGGYILG